MTYGLGGQWDPHTHRLVRARPSELLGTVRPDLMHRSNGRTKGSANQNMTAEAAKATEECYKPIALEQMLRRT